MSTIEPINLNHFECLSKDRLCCYGCGGLEFDTILEVEPRIKNNSDYHESMRKCHCLHCDQTYYNKPISHLYFTSYDLRKWAKKYCQENNIELQSDRRN